LIYFFGASARFWNFQHSHHHTNTQHKTYDIDLQIFPLIHFDSAFLSEKLSEHWWTKSQGKTWLLSSIILQIWHQYYYHLHYNLHKRNYEYFLLGFVTHYCFHIILLYHICGLSLFVSLLVMHFYLYVGGALIFVQSWFAHSYLGVHNGYYQEEEKDKNKDTEKEKEEQTQENKAIEKRKKIIPRYHYNWCELSACYTVNATLTPLTRLLGCVTTCQIEHHLWPAIPECRHEETREIVQQFFKKHGLPYYEQSWSGCFFICLE